VAFRADLIAQMHAPGWGTVIHDKLSRLCTLYGLGTPTKVCGGDLRAIELTPDFLADLLDRPTDDEADARTPNSYTREGKPRPSVREAGQTQSPQEDSQDTEPGRPEENGGSCPGSASGLSRTDNPDADDVFTPSVRVERPGCGDTWEELHDE